MNFTKRAMSVIMAIISIICLLTVLSGCGKKASDDAGRVYYLNFKPEQNSAWQTLAQKKYPQFSFCLAQEKESNENEFCDI